MATEEIAGFGEDATVANGGFVLLESRAFDPMHAELQPKRSGEPATPGAHVHGTAAGTDGVADKLQVLLAEPVVKAPSSGMRCASCCDQRSQGDRKR